jgi:tetratricopeptide (TPR) repeat protein
MRKFTKVSVISAVALFTLLWGGFIKWFALPKPHNETLMKTIGIPKQISKMHHLGKKEKIEGKFKERYELYDKRIDSGQTIREAAGILEDILRDDPNQIPALEHLGMIYLTDLDDPDQAASYIKRALAIYPDSYQAVMEVSLLVSRAPSRAFEMLDYLQVLYGANPKAGGLALGIAEVMLKQDRKTDAIPYFQKAAEDPPFAPSAYEELADIYQQIGQLDQAAASYLKGIDFESNEIDKLKAAGEAIEDSQSQHNIAYYHIKLAEIYMEQKEFDEAEQQINLAQQLFPDNSAIQLWRGRLEGSKPGSE